MKNSVHSVYIALSFTWHSSLFKLGEARRHMHLAGLAPKAHNSEAQIATHVGSSFSGELLSHNAIHSHSHIYSPQFI